jgi:hypothetical protein
MYTYTHTHTHTHITDGYLSAIIIHTIGFHSYQSLHTGGNFSHQNLLIGPAERDPVLLRRPGISEPKNNQAVTNSSLSPTFAVCVKGLTQLHVGGRIPVVTVQNLGAKAMMEHFFFPLFFNILGVVFLYQREERRGTRGQQQQQFPCYCLP